MSPDEALGLLTKWKVESTPVRSVAVVIGDIVTVRFRGFISEVDASRLILTQDRATNLIVNWLAQAARFEYRDAREVSAEEQADGEKIDCAMKIQTGSVLVSLYVMEGPYT